MTHPHSLTSPFLAALALSGCSVTGGGSTDVYDALASGMSADAVGTDGTSVATGSAEVTMNRSATDLRVAVDGTVYDMTRYNQTTTTNSQWQNQVRYDVYQFDNSSFGDSAELIAGQYMAVTGLEDGQNGNVYLMHGGVETPTSGLPNQSAIYEGAWEIGHLSGATNDFGVFEAGANFDAGSIAFDIQNNSGTNVGSGAGSISGSSFNSSFDVNQEIGSVGTATNNDVSGNFYGPNAEEMAGIMQGNDALGAQDPTYGVLYGHQQ